MTPFRRALTMALILTPLTFFALTSFPEAHKKFIDLIYEERWVFCLLITIVVCITVVVINEISLRNKTQKKLSGYEQFTAFTPAIICNLEQQRAFDHKNLHALINNTKDLMWSVDRSLKFITSNTAFDEMVKQVSGKVMRNGDEILNIDYGEAINRKYKNYYERAFAGETFTEINYSELPVEHWSEDSFYPIFEKEKVIGTACFSRNITSQKTRERHLKQSLREKKDLAERMYTVLDMLPASIAVLNEKGIIVEVNNRWRDFADQNNFQGENYGIGQNYITISDGSSNNIHADGKKVAKGIKSILAKRTGEFVHEYPSQSLGGKQWFRMVVTPLNDRIYNGAVVMHLDISEIKRMEAERLQDKLIAQRKLTTAMLEAQEKERNQLGSDLHDNICQILAATKMTMDFCYENYPNSQPLIKDCLKYMNEAIQETRNISHRMIIPRFAETSLQEALHNLSNIYINEKRNITIEFEPGIEETPSSVKETLYRIVQEKLNNIEKHAFASSVIILVSIKERLVHLSIEDDGVGFDMRMKRTGVGIKNIQSRAEVLNGSAQIYSSPGNGCRLQVQIPLPCKNEVTVD